MNANHSPKKDQCLPYLIKNEETVISNNYSEAQINQTKQDSILVNSAVNKSENNTNKEGD